MSPIGQVATLDPPRVIHRQSATAPSRTWDIQRLAVVALCLMSAVLVLILTETVFAHLSVNNDESVYLLQARSIAHGQLFPPAPHPATSFTPWLGVIRDGHYVLKYTPVVASFLSLSLLLTGGYAAALAFWAASLVAATFLLGKEATGDRTTAALAAGLVSASPLVVVQSALALPYLPFLVLIELALWALLVGARRGNGRLLALSGAFAGVAFAVRSFDSLLILTPTLGWLLWKARGRRVRSVGWLLAGGMWPALALLWFDYLATGSALRLPFSLFSPSDSLGFGAHRLYPEEPAHEFGIAQGWQGLARHLTLLGGGWAFGGLVLLLLAAAGLIRHRVPPACLSLLAGAGALTCGYLFFWGTWNAAVVWGAVRYLGPYYLMPVLVPVSMVAAIQLRSMALSSRPRTVAVLVVAAALSAYSLIPALTANAALGSANAELASVVAAKGRSIVFVDAYPGYLQHPTAVISNASPVGGRTVYALHRGADDFEVLRSFPGRPVYELRLLGEYGRRPHSGYGAVLQRLRLISGASITMEVDVRPRRLVTDAELLVSVGNRLVSALEVGAAQTRVPLTFSSHQLPELKGEAVTISLATRVSPEGPKSESLVLSLIRTRGGLLQMLVPEGPSRELGPSAPPQISIGDTPGRR